MGRSKPIRKACRLRKGVGQKRSRKKEGGEGRVGSYQVGREDREENGWVEWNEGGELGGERQGE